MADKEEYVSGEEYQAMSRNKLPKQGHQVSVPTQAVGVVIVVVILCVVSFFIGDSYGKNHAKTTASTNSLGGGAGGFGGGGFRNGGGFGQVTAISSSSITVQNPRSGTSTTYSITSSTKITDNGQTVTASDIKTGDTVILQVASSGSTTATSILVNPSHGGGAGANSGSSASGSSTTGGSSTTNGSSTVSQ